MDIFSLITPFIPKLWLHSNKKLCSSFYVLET